MLIHTYVIGTWNLTYKTNSKIAGITFLLYIAVGITQMIVFGGLVAGDGMSAKLAAMAQHETALRVNSFLGLLTNFMALLLGITLYRLTKTIDPDIAVFAMFCRLGEGIIGAAGIPIYLGLITVVSPSTTKPVDTQSLQAVASVIWGARAFIVVLCAFFFAVGSTAFCWLFIRGQLLPKSFAWFGFFASILLVVGLPLQFIGIIHGVVTTIQWIPMALFEIPFGVWLIVKGILPNSVVRCA